MYVYANVLCVQVCVAVFLFQTVLSELYQAKMMTQDEVERMKEEGGDLSYRVVLVQCTKPPEVVAKTADMLDKCGQNETATLLRG